MDIEYCGNYKWNQKTDEYLIKIFKYNFDFNVICVNYPNTKNNKCICMNYNIFKEYLEEIYGKDISHYKKFMNNYVFNDDIESFYVVVNESVWNYFLLMTL